MRRVSSGGEPRKALKFAGLLAPVALAALVLGLACGGESSSTPTPPPATTTAVPSAVPVVEATPEPTPEVVLNRNDCDAIRGAGMDFRSDEERTWFEQNCFPPPPTAALGVQSPIGDRLSIPSIGVNTTIYSAAVPDTGAMPDPSGYFNAVWYDFSRMPGLGGYAYTGNLVLSGHVDCARCNNGGVGTAIFWNVRNMKVGDTAQYTLADGTSVNYVVTDSRSYSVDADWGTIVSSGTADMTLITCTGSFSGGEYTMRHVVALKKA